VVHDANGTAITCHWCYKPAVARVWGWHWMFGRLPLFLRLYYVCENHRTTVRKDSPADLAT
jgi:hypothetical protein